jgi:prophage antirepressor-like protein
MESSKTPTVRAFKFGTQKVEVQLDENGKEWFKAVDVLSCLGYSVKSYSNAIKKNCREKGVAKRKTLSVVPVHKTDSKCSVVRNQEHEANFIDEPNLYRLVMVSKKAEAESFQDWVTEIVLPSIRRTGSYGTQKAKQEAPVPRAKDDSLAYLNKKLNSTYTRAYWVKHGRAPDVEEYRRLATFINSLALGTKEIEQRQVMTDTGAIRVTNLLIMLIRGFETGSIDTQQTRNTYVKLYGQSTTFLTLVDRDLIKQLSA